MAGAEAASRARDAGVTTGHGDHRDIGHGGHEDHGDIGHGDHEDRGGETERSGHKDHKEHKVRHGEARSRSVVVATWLGMLLSVARLCDLRDLRGLNSPLLLCGGATKDTTIKRAERVQHPSRGSSQPEPGIRVPPIVNPSCLLLILKTQTAIAEADRKPSIGRTLSAGLGGFARSATCRGSPKNSGTRSLPRSSTTLRRWRSVGTTCIGVATPTRSSKPCPTNPAT